MSCNDIFKQTSIDLYAQEGAKIEAELDVEKTSVKAVSGGIIRFDG